MPLPLAGAGLSRAFRSWVRGGLLLPFVAAASGAALWFLPVLFLACPAGIHVARAAPAEPSPLHWTARRITRQGSRVELVGSAAVHQQGESILGDRILLDLNARTLEAQGNCIYIASESVIYGDEMNFNLDTRTGSIVGGKVTNERFTLTGKRLNKLGTGRFQTHRGAYTTCMDCPAFWTLSGEDVDLEIEGYARMKNVSAHFKDAPLFWLPYLIVPMKSQRQTGLLFPRLGFTNEGFTYVMPFFWAISRSADMTLGVGEYGGRGFRLEWEGRYRLSDRSVGRANLFLLKDKTFEEYLTRLGLTASSSRWAVDVEQTQELPFGIEQKFRLTEVSDNNYPYRIGDVRGSGDATVSSELFFSGATEGLSAYLVARRYRNLISLDPDPRKFDPETVQVLPAAVLTSNDRFLFGLPVAAGVALGAYNFTRTTDPFDRDLLSSTNALAPPNPGVDPIRKATRASVMPRVYTTVRPWGILSATPSVEYRAYFYSFHNELPNLTRGYPLFQFEFATQAERIYDTSNPDIPKVKHLIRPTLTYSRIPFVNEDATHPFLRQIRYAQDNGFSGYNFDNHDIIPVETSRNYNNYFTPLGNSVSLGLSTQWIRRRGKLDILNPGYERMAELRAGQTIDFQEYRRPISDRQPFSRFNASGGLSLDHFSTGLDYYHYPYAVLDGTTSRNVWSGSMTYVLDKAIHQRILAFERSFTLGYTYNKVQGSSQTNNLRLGTSYSLSDFWMPSAQISYDLASKKLLRLDLGVKFQHWSQCIRMETRYSVYSCEKIRPEDSGVCTTVGFDLTLNLTGSGFGGIAEVASQVVK